MSYRLMGVAGSDLVGGSIPSGPAKGFVRVSGVIAGTLTNPSGRFNRESTPDQEGA